MSSAAVNGLAGAGGGIIAQIITYPLQTVNTRQQTERSAKKRKAGSGASATHSSTLFQMLQLIQTEGWGGLYSGLKPSLIGTAASQGIYYYFYQILKNKVEDIAVARSKKGLWDGTVGMLSWLGIAAVAGSINVLLTNPIWVLVTRMQSLFSIYYLTKSIFTIKIDQGMQILVKQHGRRLQLNICLMGSYIVEDLLGIFYTSGFLIL